MAIVYKTIEARLKVKPKNTQNLKTLYMLYGIIAPEI